MARCTPAAQGPAGMSGKCGWSWLRPIATVGSVGGCCTSSSTLRETRGSRTPVRGGRRYRAGGQAYRPAVGLCPGGDAPGPCARLRWQSPRPDHHGKALARPRVVGGWRSRGLRAGLLVGRREEGGPATDTDHPGARTHLVDGHSPNRSVWERVKEMLPQQRRSPCTDGESQSSA